MLQTIIGDNQLCTLCYCLPGIGDSIWTRYHDCLCLLSYQHRLVTHLYGIAAWLHPLWPLIRLAAITTSDDCNLSLLRKQEICKPDDQRRLTCAADRQITHNDNWYADTETLEQAAIKAPSS